MNLLPEKLKQALFNEHIRSQAGRQILANSMIQPLRENRDYMSVARKSYLVEQIPNGVMPYYDKDPLVRAYIMGEEGQSIVSQVKPDRVMFPLWMITSHPQVSLTEIADTRYDVVQRSIDKGKSAIMAVEDGKSFAIMDGAATDPLNPNTDINAVAPIIGDNFADAFGQITSRDLRVAYIYMNAMDYADILKWGRDILDIETQKELLETGQLAKLWGAQIMVSRVVEAGKIYVCGEKEFMGRMPVSMELTVLSADKPESLMVGFNMFQRIGIGIHNPQNMTRILVSR